MAKDPAGGDTSKGVSAFYDDVGGADLRQSVSDPPKPGLRFGTRAKR